jgi:hypothetical protein
MAAECQIRCEIKQGMFSDEVTVVIHAMDSRGKVTSVSSIVPKKSITVNRKDPGHGSLRAYCIQKKDRMTSVVLPQATMENGPSLIVPTEEIIQS